MRTQDEPKPGEAFDRLPVNIQRALLVIGGILRRMSPSRVAKDESRGLVKPDGKYCNIGGNDNENRP